MTAMSRRRVAMTDEFFDLFVAPHMEDIYKAAEKQLEEKMDRWVYLNDLAERIEAQKNNG